jgi:hypothetical protein
MRAQETVTNEGFSGEARRKNDNDLCISTAPKKARCENSDETFIFFRRLRLYVTMFCK